MNPATRDITPWDDEAAEIWVLNEMYHYPFTKRWDRMFQIHPRWDFMRTNNFNDPNHPNYLTNQSAPCLFCKGLGVVKIMGKEGKCPECVEGTYHPPEYRMKERPIYMQKHSEDIPFSVAFPLDEITKTFQPPDEESYFTSTVSMMLGLALLMEFKEIVMYGFEMGTGTEYHYQRNCAEYWMGYCRGKGVKLTAPESGLLKGPLYAYKSVRTGFRQQLEMRKSHLEGQIQLAEHAATLTEGAISGLLPFKDHADVGPAFAQAFDTNYHNKGFLNFLRGTLREVENMMALHDTYFIENMSNDAGEATPYKDATKHIGLTYQMGK
jgi:hypothetical protein